MTDFNPFSIFIDFSNYLGWKRAFIMVACFYLLMWAYQKLPIELEKSENKVAKFFCMNLRK